MQAREGRETNHNKSALLVAMLLAGAILVPSGPTQAGPGKSKGPHKAGQQGSVDQAYEAFAGVAGDMHADGLADVLWRNLSRGENLLWRMNGLSRDSSDPVDPMDPQWQIAGVGDFDGDSRSDILWRHPDSTETVVWLMDGAFTAYSANVGSVSAGWQVEGIGDFNGDGKCDILWRNAGTRKIFIWQMDGMNKFDKTPIGAVDASWSVAGVGDFDGDDMADILWRSAGTRATFLKLWVMDGFAVMDEQDVARVSVDWSVAQVRDYNGSGQADILWRSPRDERVVVWQMNGSAIEGTAVVGELGPDWAVH